MYSANLPIEGVLLSCGSGPADQLRGSFVSRSDTESGRKNLAAKTKFFLQTLQKLLEFGKHDDHAVSKIRSK